MDKPKNYHRALSMEEILEAERQIQKVFDEFIELYAPRQRIRSLSEVADSPPGEINEVEEILVTDEISPALQPQLLKQSCRVQEDIVSEKKIQEVAREIARVGDALVTKHGEKVQTMEVSLTRLITEGATSQTYDTFSKAVEKVVGEEKTWTNLMVVMYLSKRILSQTSTASTAVAQNFRRFVGGYSNVIAEHGGVANFVRERPMSQ